MRHVLPIWAVILAVFVTSTSIYGGYHFFSPIPYLDQWQGYVGFYRHFSERHYDALWAQHMEHRILLPRLLFLLDIRLFGGWNIFTVVVNYLIILATGLLIFVQCVKGRRENYSLWLVGGLIFGFLFLWCQNENLKWGFQSAGLAVYLFAFAAFACFSGDNNRKWRLFWAVLLTLMSVVSMGNGIAAFGVMIGQALLQRRPLKEAVIVGLAGVVTAAIYFHGYVKPVPPVDPVAAQTVAARLKYLFFFLGNPVYYARPSFFLTGVLGAAFLLISLLTLYVLRLRGVTTRYQSFLAAMICMVIIAAVGAANGRWMLGLQYSTSSRYTTPMVMGYLALTLLLLDVSAMGGDNYLGRSLTMVLAGGEESQAA